MLQEEHNKVVGLNSTCVGFKSTSNSTSDCLCLTDIAYIDDTDDIDMDIYTHKQVNKNSNPSKMINNTNIFKNFPKLAK